MAYFLSRIALALTGLLFAFSGAPSHAAGSFSPQKIEQLVAPIALYPDPLLSQVLMAATYPVEVVEAARWRADQPERLSDRQLAQMLQDQPWDPSVKSLAAFPDVLSMMNDNISWTDQLGEAFLDQQQEVMDAVQRLRARAQAAGNLRSSSQQVVSFSDNPAIISILPAQPDVIYVPIYNPTVIYGAWPYPNYQPFYWHPPRYAVSGPAITFAGALIVGGVLWSTYDWHQHRFHVDVNRYNRFNRTRITSERWHQDFEHRRVEEVNRNAVGRDRFDNQRRNNAQAPVRENGNPQYRNQAAPNNNGVRVPNSGYQRPGTGAPRTENRVGGQPPQRAPQPPATPQSGATPQSRPNHQSQTAPQFRPAPQHVAPESRPAPHPQATPRPQMPSPESRRAPSMERPANVTRVPREPRNNDGGNAYGNRGGGRNEAGRPPEQRRAQPQERGSQRNENSGRPERNRD